MTEEYDKVARILMKNSNKDFVKRILAKDLYPSMDLGGGKIATHQMGWTEADGKYIVHPNILYDGKSLKDYGDKSYSKAKETGDFIEFDTPEEADWFSRRYKVFWE